MASTSRQVQLDLQSPFIYTGVGAVTNSTTGVYDEFGLQGIKGADTSGSYLITGTSGPNGVIYNGPIDHAMTTSGSGSGTWTVMNVPTSFNASSTSIYGVDNLGNNDVALVGSYTSNASVTDSSGTYYPRIGFYYSGAISASPSSADFTSFSAINPDTGKAAEITYIHSISGGLAVGNCDDFFDGQVAGHAFIYDTVTGLQTNINYPGTGKSNSAYGIWSNSSSSYTIAGGVGSVGISEGDGRDGDPLGKATLIDYDSITGKFSHYQTYSFTKKTLLPKTLRRQVIVTHFEGIWTDGQGLYKLPATIATEDGQLAVGALATVKRNRDGSFGKAAWSVFDIPGTSLSTNDSVFGDANVGLATYSNGGGTSDYAGLVL
jgi:hypothetical protein